MEERRQYQHKPMSREEGKDALIAEAYKVMQEDDRLIYFVARSNEILVRYIKDNITTGLLTSQGINIDRFIRDTDYRIFLYRRKLIDGLRQNNHKGLLDYEEVQNFTSDERESPEVLLLKQETLQQLEHDIDKHRALSETKKQQLKAIIAGTLEGKNKKMIAEELGVNSSVISQVLAVAKNNMPKYAEVWESFVGRHHVPVMEQKSDIVIRDVETLKLVREDLAQKDNLTGEEKILLALVRWYTDDTYTREDRDAIFLEQGIKKMTQKKLKFYLNKLDRLSGRPLSFKHISTLANKK